MIPKIIHQTFPTKQIAVPVFENITRLKNINPGWEYRFYDDAAVEKFIVENYDAAVASAYSRINPVYGAARADLFRYLLMYKVGGVYLDIKSTCEQPFDNFIRPDDVYILSHWSSLNSKNALCHPYWGAGHHPDIHHLIHGEFVQWMIIAAPAHPFLKAVIEQVLKNIDAYTVESGTGKVAVLRLTGPIVYTLTIENLLPTAPYRMIESYDEGIRYSIFDKKVSTVHKDHLTLFANHYSVQTAPVVLTLS